MRDEEEFIVNHLYALALHSCALTPLILQHSLPIGGCNVETRETFVGEGADDRCLQV